MRGLFLFVPMAEILTGFFSSIFHHLLAAYRAIVAHCLAQNPHKKGPNWRDCPTRQRTGLWQDEPKCLIMFGKKQVLKKPILAQPLL